MSTVYYLGTPEGVTAALEALGKTPADVAVTLHTLGHDGAPVTAVGGPIGWYLRDVVSRAANAGVVWYETILPGRAGLPDLEVTQFDAQVFLTDGTTVQVPLPAPVAGFVDHPSALVRVRGWFG